MAGSFNHVVRFVEGNRVYKGTDLLENMGDMKEAVDEMAFLLLYIEHHGGRYVLNAARTAYELYTADKIPCPDFFNPVYQSRVDSDD